MTQIFLTMFNWCLTPIFQQIISSTIRNVLGSHFFLSQSSMIDEMNKDKFQNNLLIFLILHNKRVNFFIIHEPHFFSTCSKSYFYTQIDVYKNSFVDKVQFDFGNYRPYSNILLLE